MNQQAQPAQPAIQGNNPNYSWVFGKLVQGPDDVHGALAYVLYKEHKIAFLEKFKSTHGGIEPSEADWQTYHIAIDTDTALEGFKERAEALLESFLDQLLAAEVAEAKEEVKRSFFATEIRDAQNGLAGKIDAARQLVQASVDQRATVIDGKIDGVSASVSAGKGFGSWARDLGINLVVNFLTVVLIGLAVFGAAQMDRFSGWFQNRVDTASSTKLAPPSTPD